MVNTRVHHRCTSKAKTWLTKKTSPSLQNVAAARVAAKVCRDILDQSRFAHLRVLRQRLSNGILRDKQWWSTNNQAGGSGRNSSFLTLVNSEGEEFITSSGKAECFGEHFSAKCSLSQDFVDEELPHVQPRTENIVLNVHFRQWEVRRELRNLNPSKATGPDGISAIVLKEWADDLVRPLSLQFSLCFRNAYQPASWKIANVVPIFKKNSKSQPSNYRPVSLLPIISKIMGRITSKSLTNFLEKHLVLSNRQFGFRSGLGTSDLLVSLHH